MNGKDHLLNADYYKKISNAKMGLNLSYNNGPAEDGFLYSSDRISQYTGSGLLTFSTYENSLNLLFEEDKEMIFFTTKEELLDKIIYYKKHDEKRKKIAKAGWKKSHNYFNERLVAKYIVETTCEIPYSETYAWPLEKY